jgi:prepilin-type N-terminal cleavage/methylation domain-containing protein
MTGVDPQAHIPWTEDSRGFTLMELVVVLGIFTTVVVAASDIFLLASRSQRKIFNLERTQSDARFTMEAITREIRTGEIDYGYYEARAAPIGFPDDELVIIDSNNTRIRFFRSLDPSECVDAASTPCLMVGVDANAPVTITPKDVVVRNASFYVTPQQDPQSFDPATGTYAADVRPHVTIVLMLESTRGRAGEGAVVSLQTTVATRTYRR